MLSGRYPSDEFAELRPRLTWDRVDEHADGARGRAARRRHQRRHHSRSRTLRRLPGRRARPGARGSASSTRRWSSRAASATPSCSAPRPGASRRSRTTACWCRPRRASRARCRSGRRLRRAGRSSSGAHIGELMRELRAACRRPRAIQRLVDAPRPRCSSAAENLLRYLDDQAAADRRGPGRSHHRHRALPRRARRLAHLRALAVRRPHPRAVGDGGRSSARAPRPASTSRRCGPTTASWCAFRRRRSRPTRRC